MNISVIYIKQNKSNNAETFEQHFLNKLEKINSIKMIPISIKKKFNSRALQIEEEGKAIEKKLKHKEELICFDKSGETMSSEKFSKGLNKSYEVSKVSSGTRGLQRTSHHGHTTHRTKKTQWRVNHGWSKKSVKKWPFKQLT